MPTQVKPSFSPASSTTVPCAFGSSYSLEALKGSNMALVYQGVRIADGAKVAVKICVDRGLHAQFEREIKHTRDIKDKAVVPILESGRALPDNHPYYISPWIEGPDLGGFLQDPAKTFPQKASVFLKLCQVVARLHEKSPPLVHRDLKPANVKIEEEGEIKLFDLGLARTDGETHFTTAVGTPGYVPNELEHKKARHEEDAAHDVYSLAVMLVQVLTGLRPRGRRDPDFESSKAVDLLRLHLPHDRRFDALIQAGLTETRSARPANARVLATWLEACMASTVFGSPVANPTPSAPVLGSSPSPTPLVQRSSRRGRPRRELAFIAVVALAVGGVWRHQVDPTFWPRLAGYLIEIAFPPPPLPPPPPQEPIAPLDYGRAALHVQIDPAKDGTNSMIKVVDFSENDRVLKTNTIPANGLVSYWDLPSGKKIRVEVFKPGYQISAPILQVGRDGAGTSTPYRIELDPLRGSIVFRTTPGAKLDIWRDMGARLERGPADATGRIEVKSLVEGDWHWRLELADHQSAIGTVANLIQGKPRTVEQTLKALGVEFNEAGEKESTNIFDGTALHSFSASSATNIVEDGNGFPIQRQLRKKYLLAGLSLFFVSFLFAYPLTFRLTRTQDLGAERTKARAAQIKQAKAAGIPLEILTAKSGITFRFIPSGTFRMGSPIAEEGRADDELQHKVTLTKAFYAGKTEVTKDQWKLVMGSDPSYFKDVGGDFPVEQVSWDDCQSFLFKLCRLEGLPQGTFRMLTEAEWEYASRSGTTADRFGDLDHIAWYAANAAGRTHQVAGSSPNAWGLYDTLGNVMEWCSDWYDNYPGGAVTDPSGPCSGTLRVYRGGSWRNKCRYSRQAVRHKSVPNFRNYRIGLRIAMTIP